jgi:C-terminal processing protease CtpA/Prc
MRTPNRLSPAGRLILFGAVLLALLSVARAGTTAGPGPVNLDLEDGELGKVPTGWLHPKPSVNAGYQVCLTDEDPKSGKRCAVISREDGEVTSGPGKLMQSFDAAAYRGKRVRLRAAVRAELSGFRNRATLWLRVDRKGGQPGLLDNCPVFHKEWRDCEILGEVADDAVSISLGLMLTGNGRAWLDAVSFEVIGKAGEGNEPARPLQEPALENLVAFTRLLGYVRYFHPSDEAAALDWDTFALEGVTAVEPAKGPAELARVLQERFRPIAPTVRVFPTKEPPAPDPAPPQEAASAKVVAWYHFGVGMGDPASIYRSVRVTNKEPVPSLPTWKLPEMKLPDPGKPFIADLGAGVSCRVPLALYADGNGTLPHTAAPAKAVASTKPPGFTPTGKDRSTRLAAVALAWNVFQHFYPYFDVVKTDWPAELRRALTKAATDPDEDAFLETLHRLVAGLHDGHGNVGLGSAAVQHFYPPLRWDWIEDRLVVTRVAAVGAGGLKPGCVVLKVDGRPAAEALAEQEQLISGATPQWKRYRALVRLAEGAKGSEMTLDTLSPAGEARVVRLHRTVDIATFQEFQEPARPAKVEAIKPDVLYVDLSRVTDKEYAQALPQLEKAKGVILDLRGYPRVSPPSLGHLIDKPVTCPQWHVPVVLYPDQQNMAFAFSDWQVKPKEPRFQGKVAFLTDGRAISYAETYLGIVEHYKLAAIVGAPTAGTNGNINPFRLPGGYRVTWTGMRVLKHDGSRQHGIGIQPTVPVRRTIQGVAQGRDEVLQRALEVVSP